MSNANEKNAPRIRLSEALAYLRDEIQTAINDGSGKVTRFRAKSIELELSVTFGLDAKGTGGLKVWVFELGGTSSVKRDEIQRLKLTLELEGNPLISDPVMPPLTISPPAE